VIRFSVLGEPKPQGSKRAFVSPQGRAVMKEQAGSGLRTWRERMHVAAAEHAPDGGPWTGPVAVAITFRLPTPQAVKTRWPIPKNKGDLDKLVRSALDALTGVLFADDSQVVHLTACKVFDATPGADVIVMDEAEILRGGLGFADLLGHGFLLAAIEPRPTRRRATQREELPLAQSRA
jgi:crossover junction endodeoxyribonuclease RusA